MSDQNSAFSWPGYELFILILLQSRTSQNESIVRQDICSQISITQPPVDNQVSLECLSFLKRSLNSKKTRSQYVYKPVEQILFRSCDLPLNGG